MHRIALSILFLFGVTLAFAHTGHRGPELYDPGKYYAPTPVPDRVVLTWAEDPATTQSVTWRTDTTVEHAVAQIALANANGRALEPDAFTASTSLFSSDLGDAHYHSLTFRNLRPETLYAYRVGDGVNWSEYFHFKTASQSPKPFSFIYFGDAQNDLKTHWSRVFREAFRDAPRAAFILHAGDLVNRNFSDEEWGEWHGAPGWVNGTIPVIATPGNHEYFRANPGPRSERWWNSRAGTSVAVDVELERLPVEGAEHYRITATLDAGSSAWIVIEDNSRRILEVSDSIGDLFGWSEEELIGTQFNKAPLMDRARDPGTPAVSRHWRQQFAFPVQNPPAGLEETCYYVDYQGVRFISLDSNQQRKEQVEWLRAVLRDNPNRWTILTCHHPFYSPAGSRDNPELRELWKPLLETYKVDLVLTGHDHTYARTGQLDETVSGNNFPTGYQQAYDPEIGTVYVVSVSGPKMYNITKGEFAVRVAEDTQLYQIISIGDDVLTYNAYTATGNLYDSFTLTKRDGQPNTLEEILPKENRRKD